MVTPIERTIVTTVASPSGIAATAKLTATIKELRTGSKWKSPALIILNANINKQIPKTIQVSVLLNCASFICKGVLPSSACVRAVAILPISVFIPVSVITALPRP